MDAQQRQREQEIAAQVEPQIVEALGNGEEPRTVASRIAAEYEIDEVKAYRWAYYIDERYQKKRRVLLAFALTAMWIGAIAVAVGLGVIIFAAVTTAWIVTISLGALVALPALLVALLARRIVYRPK